MFGMAGETEFDLRFYLMGIPIRVHPIFWVTSAWLVWQVAGGEPIRVFIGVLCIFVSVLVHELGHAFLARRYGFPSEIVLYFLGGFATATRFSTWKNVKVSAAGPCAGFGLFALTYITFRILAVQHPESLIGDHPLGFAIQMMMFANLTVNLMNLIPCIPLDGGRIVESLFNRYGGHTATLRTLQVGILSSALVCLRSLQCMNDPARDLFPIPQALFPSFVVGDMIYTWLPGGFQPDPRFMLIFFGILCAQQIATYNEYNSHR